ncbi:MAG: response regulator [Methanotrichaceae archaeon]|jgi:CheY-like chemotaxis protein
MTRSNSIARILLAEDDPASQKVALAMLHRLGYEADTVNDGLEVLQALKRQRYFLVLMDIVMLKMDGIAATKEIRRRFPASEWPKIVAFTAYVHPDVKKKCLAAGMDDYISKPVKKEELEAILMKYSGEPARSRLCETLAEISSPHT